MLNYIITDSTITVLINNRPEIIDESHPNFTAVLEILKRGDGTEKEVYELINISKAVENFGEGNIEVISGEIFYKGKLVESALTRRILSLMENGFDITPFVKFMNNLYENPSYRAVQETYGFLEACNLPITEDGHFLAYKKVRDDYKDVYSGTFDNSIGQVCEMPRNEVDEDSNRTCSAGLHVASYSYMSVYSGDRIVICKINPRDVVAVPDDYNNSKMRVCKYEVVGEVGLENEELPENAIRDEEIPNISKTEDKETVLDFNTLYDMGENDALEFLENYLRENDFETVKDAITEDGDFMWAEEYIRGINKNTSFWKDNLIENFKTDLDII